MEHAALSVAGTDCQARDVYLLQVYWNLNRGAVVHRDRVNLGAVGYQGRGADVEDPLLIRSVPMKSSIAGRVGNSFVDACHRPRYDLGQRELAHRSCSSHRHSIHVADAELSRDGASLLPDTRAVRVDWLQNLMSRSSQTTGAQGLILHSLAQSGRRAAIEVAVPAVNCRDGCEPALRGEMLSVA